MSIYRTYRFCNGDKYRVEIGKDGVTEDDMRKLRSVIKTSHRAYAKGDRLEVISIETGEADSSPLKIADPRINVELTVEITDKYETLHKAISTLTAEQQSMVRHIFFENVSIREYAKIIGKSHTAVRKYLAEVYATIKLLIKI